MAEHEVTQTPCVPLYGLLAASLAASTTSTVSHVNVHRDGIVWDPPTISTISTVSHVNVQRDGIVWDRDGIVALARTCRHSQQLNNALLRREFCSKSNKI